MTLSSLDWLGTRALYLKKTNNQFTELLQDFTCVAQPKLFITWVNFAKPTNPMRYLLLIWIVFAAGCSSLSPKPNPAETDSGNWEQRRHAFELENGLKVVVLEDFRAPVVMTQVWYKVGSVDEPAGKGGISHLLEHMMFKGTDKVSGTDFDRIVARFGGSQNAFTSHDYTGYYQLYPAQGLELALELEADRMSGLKLTQEDLNTEREVVKEERRQRLDDNPHAQAYEAFRQLLYGQSSRANPIIGSMQDLNSITLNDLTDWYKAHYKPSNAVLVVVGAAKAEQVHELAKQYFNQADAGTQPTKEQLTKALTHTFFDSFRSLSVNKDVANPSLYLGFNVPSLTSSKDNLPQPLQALGVEKTAYGLALLTQVLDGGLSARLESQLVRGSQSLASVGTSYDLFQRGDSAFFIAATPRQGVSLETAKQQLLAQLETLKDQSQYNAFEIQRAKTNYLASMIYSQDQISAQARLIGELQSLGLSDTLIPKLTNSVTQITPSELALIADTFFVETNMAEVFVLPTDKEQAP